MSVIAWDGLVLAADKQATVVGLRKTVTKIFKHNGELFYSDGDFGKFLEVMDWYKAGADPEKYPTIARDVNASPLNVIKAGGKIYVYDQSPIPFLIEDRFAAAGTGRDYAIAAMSLGYSSKAAVEIACKFDIYCGMGIDTLTL